MKATQLMRTRLIILLNASQIHTKQPLSQGLFVVKHGVDRGPGKGWLSHDQIFQYIWKIYYSTRKVAGKIFQLYWEIWSCDIQPLPGPSTSRSTTEALGTRLHTECCNIIVIVKTQRHSIKKGKRVLYNRLKIWSLYRLSQV